MGGMLQDWITVTCQATGASTGVLQFTQDTSTWSDLHSASGLGVWIDVASVVNPIGATVQLTLQGSPSHDETYFLAIAQPVTLVASTSPLFVGALQVPGVAPLSRWLRWQLNLLNPASGSWGATFRIQTGPVKAPPFIPTQLPGCVLWLRGDMGITLSTGAVSQWNDQSGAGDSNRNLVNGVGLPVYTAADSSYNNTPTVGFQSANHRFMTSSGTWSSTVNQPMTWVYVGHNTGAAALTQYIMDGDTGTTGLAASYATSTDVVSLLTTAAPFSSGALPWTSPTAALFEYNGASSNIYLGNFSTVGATGTVGTGASNAYNSMTLGSHSAFWGASNYWDGTVAEVIAYSNILPASSKARLRSYINARYGLTVA